MPVYEVRRRTVLAVATVTAANETEAKCLARDVWQQDAAIAALTADVVRIPYGPDDDADERSETRYNGPDERDGEQARRWGLYGADSDSEAIPWP